MYITSIFNKETEIKEKDIKYPDYFYFEINIWIPVSNVTKEEKKINK